MARDLQTAVQKAAHGHTYMQSTWLPYSACALRCRHFLHQMPGGSCEGGSERTMQACCCLGQTALLLTDVNQGVVKLCCLHPDSLSMSLCMEPCAVYVCLYRCVLYAPGLLGLWRIYLLQPPRQLCPHWVQGEGAGNIGASIVQFTQHCRGTGSVRPGSEWTG
jgi:hypothetical protein